MTSIGLFSRGFKSVYINEENEFLGWCTQASTPDNMDTIPSLLTHSLTHPPPPQPLQEPDNMDWRIKQLFRWHYGAVELFGMGIFKLQARRG